MSKLMGLENGKIINLMKSRILPIKGDASFRQFYRFTSKKNKIIIVAKKEKYKNLIAYSAINRFLRSNKILTPKLYDLNFLKGIMIVEDFGNSSFYNLILKKKKKFSMYKKLVDLLIKIQKIKPQYKIKSPVSRIHKIEKYSNKYLFMESDLFFDWYLPLFLNNKRVKIIKKKSNKILKLLYNKLNFPNSYFVHRDYHLQNLMKVDKKIGVLDSQDALIGNPTYDLVSLVDDVRIRTSSKLKNKIYNYYLKRSSKIHRIQKREFLEDFNILSVQRTLKIIGIFSRLYKRDSKKTYLKFIPYAWKILEMRLNSEVFLGLKKIFDSNIPKKIRKKIIS
tara:strand:- start:591 stop:1598 length:1008 start_codon:yes stop_codon:yes gene_type:complete